MERQSDCNPKDRQALFKPKKFLLRVMTTKECDLSNDEAKTFSCLVYKARDKKPVTIKEIASRTGLERGRSGKKTQKARGVSRHLARLIELDLAEKVKGGYIAKEPKGTTMEWYAWKDKGEEWWDRIARYPVFALATGIKSKGNQKGQKMVVELTQSASDLYFLLISLAGWKDKLHGQTQSGLANMLGISRRTVYATLDQLQELHLVSADNYTFTLAYPSEALILWRDRKAAPQAAGSEKPQPRAEKPTAKPQPSARITQGSVAEVVRQKYQGVATASDIEELIVPLIGRYHKALDNIGYNMQDFRKLLDALSQVPHDSDEFFLYLSDGGDFINDIRESEQINTKNGKRQHASSVDVLFWKINQRFKS